MGCLRAFFVKGLTSRIMGLSNGLLKGFHKGSIRGFGVPQGSWDLVTMFTHKITRLKITSKPPITAQKTLLAKSPHPPSNIGP